MKKSLLSSQGENLEHKQCKQKPHDANLAQIPPPFVRIPEEEMLANSANFYETMSKRRSIRKFSSEEIPEQVINNIILAGGTGPSAAHNEPWVYVIVKDPEVKKQIREIVEADEKENYEYKMDPQFKSTLQCLKINWEKEYITTAPVLILVFRKVTYYSDLAIGLAIGILLSAIQTSGLAAVSTTPEGACKELRNLLGRSDDEEFCYLIPIGYPAKDVLVPDFKRKSLEEIAVFIYILLYCKIIYTVEIF